MNPQLPHHTIITSSFQHFPTLPSPSFCSWGCWFNVHNTIKAKWLSYKTSNNFPQQPQPSITSPISFLWGPSTHWLLFPSWLRVGTFNLCLLRGQVNFLGIGQDPEQKVNHFRDMLGWWEGRYCHHSWKQK